MDSQNGMSATTNSVEFSYKYSSIYSTRQKVKYSPHMRYHIYLWNSEGMSSDKIMARRY